MTRRVFNYGGGMHSPVALTQFLRDALDGEVANGMEVVAGSGMNITVKAGTASVGKDPSYDINIAGTETVNIGAASPSNPMNALIVAYVDRDVAGSTAVTDNTNDVFKLKAISGAAAATPSDPTTSAIQAAIGAANPFIILARVRKQTGATSVAEGDITDLRKMITLREGRINSSNILGKNVVDSNQIIDGSVQPRHLAQPTLLTFSADGVAQGVSGTLAIQAGWIQFYGRNTKQQTVPITFSKPFKQVFSLMPSLIGYKNSPKATALGDFSSVVGAGINLETGVITNTGANIQVSTSGILGGAWHGISWVAIGII